MIEHEGDAAQAIEIGLDVARDLQLVVAAAIVGNDLLQRLRQAVVDALHRCAVAGRQRIDQADRVAQLDRAGGLQRREEAREGNLFDIRCEPGGPDARQVADDHLSEGIARDLPERIEDRPVEQRRTVGGDQRVEPQRRALFLLLAVGAGEEAERRVGAASPL